MPRFCVCACVCVCLFAFTWIPVLVFHLSKRKKNIFWQAVSLCFGSQGWACFMWTHLNNLSPPILPSSLPSQNVTSINCVCCCPPPTPITHYPVYIYIIANGTQYTQYTQCQRGTCIQHKCQMPSWPAIFPTYIVRTQSFYDQLKKCFSPCWTIIISQNWIVFQRDLAVYRGNSKKSTVLCKIFTRSILWACYEVSFVEYKVMNYFKNHGSS